MIPPPYHLEGVLKPVFPLLYLGPLLFVTGFLRNGINPNYNNPVTAIPTKTGTTAVGVPLNKRGGSPNDNVRTKVGPRAYPLECGTTLKWVHPETPNDTKTGEVSTCAQ